MRRHRQGRQVAGAALAAIGSLVLLLAPGATTAALAAPAVVVSSSGNRLVDGAGNPIRLLGVDRSGSEYACIQGWGFFDGPSDATSAAAIKSWHTNAVRVPLNEDCWLGINSNPSNAARMGAPYRQAIKSYVATLHAAGLAVILDIHANAPGSEPSTGAQLEPMLDADHGARLWTSIAKAFLNDRGVVFDLYNEPHDISWTCWLRGCTVDDWLNPGATFRTVGMQRLVDAVRATGATQVIMAGGLGYSGDLSQWPAGLVDPAGHLAASVHVYNYPDQNPTSWNAVLAPIAATFPIVTGELGEYDCNHTFIDSYMRWADDHGVSYVGWTWDATNAPGSGWTCKGGPSLITQYDGTPTQFGIGLRDHLAAIS